MTYSSGGPGYPGAQHSGAYAPTPQHSQQHSRADDAPSKLPVYLLAAVGVLGLAAYLLTFGPVWEASEFAAGGIVMLGIIAILFAAIFAAIALVPKQANHTPLVTAAAAVGFLLVIWDLISNADVSGWALIAIVVVSALQTIAALGALLLDAGVISPPAPRPKYDPYQQQQQYGGGYYGQPQLSGHGPQHGGPPLPPSSQSTQSFNLPQGAPQYGGYQSGPPSGGFPQQAQQEGPPTPPTGFPTFAPPSSAPTTEAKAPPRHYDAPTQEVRAPEGLRAPDQPSSPSGPPPS